MGRRIRMKATSDESASFLSPDFHANSSASGSSMSSVFSDDISLCFKFNTKQFVVKCTDESNLGNGCLWIVIRDDNLLGDVDVIGASAIPLIDTMKLAKHALNDRNNNNEGTYVHFKRDVTFATCKRGYIEGQMKCERMQ